MAEKMFKKIYIEITNTCNLKCSFCPETNRTKDFMTLEKFEKVISRIHNYTNLVLLHVKGEPLLHKDLNEIFEILRRYNLKANITTNGTLIKKQLNTIKKAKSINQINFSIHSITQNKMTDNQYLKDIFESAEILSNIMISYRLWNLQSIDENSINEDIIKEIEDYYKICDLKHQLSKNNFFKLRKNIFINQDIEFSWPDINKPEIIEKGRCMALKDHIAILVDGTVVPCCLDNNGDIPLGNIFNETLQEILNKPHSVKIKKNFENNVITCKLCKTCGFLQRLENKRHNCEILVKNVVFGQD